MTSFLPGGYLPRSDKKLLKEVAHRTGLVSFERYRETVVAYLKVEDQVLFGRKEVWEGIKKAVVERVEKVREGHE